MTTATSLLALSPQAERTFSAPAASRHALPATPATVRWGAIDPTAEPVLEVASGDAVALEAVSHHAGDAPELMMDAGLDAIWAAIPEGERGPGVHVLTGPVAVAGARPGGAVAVRIGSMAPRVPYGSNCAANWGLLYDTYGKERVTVYELDHSDGTPATEFPTVARPLFGYDFTSRALYDVPGWRTPASARIEEPFSRPVRVPVRPHFGLMGVQPGGGEVLSSIPPGVFGGNVDNWRFGPGATVFYPVFQEGAGVYWGDPHFAQGDGEVCGTAIEASANATVRLAAVEDLQLRAPMLETDTHWYTHGFGADLDAAARMAVEEMIALLRWRVGLSADDAYSLCSVAMDMGVTQVVDGTLGAHCGIRRDIFL
ncbi:acetamidase/formamidase family protein [Trujillonella endophytica]|uniref:Acetamidase/formamidase n=1 Tax=Trujillonella endophytica TaxID=673521 RepID=A0A1H8UFJ8_9ACTN|nr:acetamidase/formamidase family protein [Trujillella endophytica]SEP01398.1 Acetamidase/formamidase [Trujillella endophytica]